MRKVHARVMRNLFLLTILVLANYVSVDAKATEKPTGMFELQNVIISRVR